MARRASNRDRIDRLRAEKDAERREKEERKKARAASGSSRRVSSKKVGTTSPARRLKMVWAVCNLTGDVVETFPYPRKAEAQVEAERLNGKRRGAYIVRPQKVPMD